MQFLCKNQVERILTRGEISEKVNQSSSMLKIKSVFCFGNKQQSMNN